MGKSRVLLVGNTPFSMTSYGVVLRNIIKALPDYEIFVLSRQWKEPAEVRKELGIPYLLIPSWEEDNYCFDCLPSVIERTDPSTIITIGDINIQYGYAKVLKQSWKGKKLNWLAYTPCDSDWLSEELRINLTEVCKEGTLVAMSKFGQSIFKKYGFESKLVYHGVDLDVFKPMNHERIELRKKLKLNGKFVVFTNSNNQDRKMLIQLMRGFALANIPNKFLYMHTDIIPTNEMFGGWSIKDLVKELGIDNKASPTCTFQYPGWRNDFPDSKMNLFYNVADCFIFGGNEGFGLPILEAQAAGCPVLAGNCTTMPELCEGSNLIPIKDYHWNKNTRYGILDEIALARKLEEVAKASKRTNRDLSSWTWKKVCEEWKKLII